MNQREKVKVVIIGAGFAGLWAARHLAGKDAVDVTIIDRNNYHTFLPLLYQVSAAELEPEQIAYPLRGIFRNAHNIRTVLAEVCSIDVKGQQVRTDGVHYQYDYLIVAAGSQTAYYGVSGAEEHTFALKSLEDAVHLRNRLLSCFEMAAQMKPEERPEGMLRVAVVGGGPTGVEYAGALCELMKGPLAKDFPELGANEAKVMLIDGEVNPLLGFPEKLRSYTAERLAKMGVEVQTGSAVAEVTAHSITLKDGTVIPAHTTVWSAGVCGVDSAKHMGLPLGRGGRIDVQPTLQVAGHPEIFVIGDLAMVEGQKIPMVAPNATQQGTHAAKNLLRLLEGQTPEPYIYYDKGSMVTIGRSSAVARIGKVCLTGILAWMMWLSVHLAALIGFRNRIFVMINWAMDYMFFERAVRLIMPRDKTTSCCQYEPEEPTPTSKSDKPDEPAKPNKPRK